MRIILEHPWIFISIFLFLAILLICCLIRAIKGPTIADRVVAVNMMGTIVMVVIAMLAVYMGEGYLLDICLIYAMISFLAVVVLTKVYSGVYLEKIAREKRLGQTGTQTDNARKEDMQMKQAPTDKSETENVNMNHIEIERTKAEKMETKERGARS